MGKYFLLRKKLSRVLSLGIRLIAWQEFFGNKMQKPFAGLLSDVLWYVHALDPIGVQKSDTTSEEKIERPLNQAAVL